MDNVKFVESYLPEKAAGKWVVLYFYPADFTPGCTREAKEFRDLKDEFEVSSMERAKRTTFILDTDRNIKKVWDKVSVNGHAEEVLKYISEVKK